MTLAYKLKKLFENVGGNRSINYARPRDDFTGNASAIRAANGALGGVYD